MLNVPFEGSVEIGKPPSMTDEQCSSVWAVKVLGDPGALPPSFEVACGYDVEKMPFFVTHWQPSKEDIEALVAGRGLWLKTIGLRFQPVCPFTLDEGNNINQ